jgi:hypothetical protein
MYGLRQASLLADNESQMISLLALSDPGKSESLSGY